MSGPPLECFENLNHLDKPELPQGISGGDTRSFRGKLSFARSQLNYRNFSNIFQERGRIQPARGRWAPILSHRVRRGMELQCDSLSVSPCSTWSGTITPPGVGLPPEPTMPFIHLTMLKFTECGHNQSGVSRSKRQ